MTTPPGISMEPRSGYTAVRIIVVGGTNNPAMGHGDAKLIRIWCRDQEKLEQVHHSLKSGVASGVYRGWVAYTRPPGTDRVQMWSSHPIDSAAQQGRIVNI